MRVIVRITAHAFDVSAYFTTTIRDRITEGQTGRHLCMFR